MGCERFRAWPCPDAVLARENRSAAPTRKPLPPRTRLIVRVDLVRESGARGDAEVEYRLAEYEFDR